MSVGLTAINYLVMRRSRHSLRSKTVARGKEGQIKLTHS
jgi:hypothetical protein